MKDIFSSHFTADDQRREKLWKNCIFVFDTNVLTSVYKRSDDARDALYKVISSLQDRLWIPHQVIHELLDNRASIAHQQAGLYSAAINDLNAVLENFESSKKHPFLPTALHEEFIEVSARVVRELENKRKFHDARMTDDDIKSELAEMLNGKVGSGYSDEKLKAIVKEGEFRYANKIPPGFEDIVKHKGSTVFSEVCKRYGDLIIWKQVIEKAKELKKPVILVTGEQKDDWWDRHGGKTIGPLPRLIEEFTMEVGEDFFLYSHHQFLDLANTYLEQTTSTEVIDEVRQAALYDSLKLMRCDEEGGLGDSWSNINSESHELKDFLEEYIDPNPLVAEYLAAQKNLSHLVGMKDAYTGALSHGLRSPNDPREVRRRKRMVPYLADIDNKIIAEIDRMQDLKSRINAV